MAERPVFLATQNSIITVRYEIEWAAGNSLSQKQTNIENLHESFLRQYPEKKVLEVSTKSQDEVGRALSAFNLKLFVPSLGKSVPVECAFQAGKVFADGGPYLDILDKTPLNAKRDPRLKNRRIVAFEFDGKRYPTEPKTAFYDMLYLKALEENPELAEKLLEYDAFTDIEFNPDRSLNCQARTCAVYKAQHV